MAKTTIASINWDTLCKNIKGKNLIPILGNEMYAFRKDGIDYTLESYCTSQILEKFESADASVKTLGTAVDFLLRKDNEIDDIKQALEEITSEARDYPLLNDFLAIDELFFYVDTTIYGNVLKAKIKQAGRPEVLKGGSFSTNETFKGEPGDLETLNQPFVFSIFGSLKENLAPAISGEQMLEFTTMLISKMGDAKFTAILEALKNKTLLFLGCSQPGWLIRFMFRILSNERMESWKGRRIIVVNDSYGQKETEFEFLNYCNVITYPGSTTDFVTELKQKWNDYVRVNDTPRTRVLFISYSRKDRDAANVLVAKLQTISEYVVCWYDKNNLVSGDIFPDEISINIDTADLFIPLISENSLHSSAESFVKREWLTAFNTNVKRKKNANNNKYVLPVAIDDVKLDTALLNNYFPSMSIDIVKDGDAVEEFLKTVKKVLELP